MQRVGIDVTSEHQPVPRARQQKLPTLASRTLYQLQGPTRLPTTNSPERPVLSVSMGDAKAARLHLRRKAVEFDEADGDGMKI